MLTRAVFCLGLFLATGTAHALNLECEQDLVDVTQKTLPKKDYERFELSPELTCFWSEKKRHATHSLLFKSPSAKEPVEIEIGTWLSVNQTTATHVALLDMEFQAVQWIPFSAFRERKNYLTARFFINPEDDVKYILIGGALTGDDDALVRTYSPLSTNMLRFAGLITAREINSEFKLVPEGKIRVRIRRPRTETVPIIN